MMKQGGGKGAFNKAVNALRLLIEAREKLKAPTRIYVMGLIFKQNYEDLDAFYDFVLNDIKADKLKLNFIQPTFGHDGQIDEFFAKNHQIDPDKIVEIIRHCNEKYRLNINPLWLEQVRMYFRSLQKASDAYKGWFSNSRTEEHICNSYERNIMVDLYGYASLCFSTDFPRKKLLKKGDLKKFWEESDYIRKQMKKCNKFCGISHSVRRESSTLKD